VIDNILMHVRELSVRRIMLMLLAAVLMASFFAVFVANHAEAKHRHHSKSKITTTPSTTVDFGGKGASEPPWCKM
jgi:hypothetical protein